MELYYKISMPFYDICTILFAAYCFVIWVKPFIAGNAKIWCVGAAYAVVMLVGDLIPFYVDAVFVYGSAVLAAFLVMKWIDRACIAQKLFLAVTFFCVRWQAWRVVAAVSNERALLTWHLFQGKSEMFWFWIYAVELVVDGAFGCMLMYGGFKCLQWTYGCRREQMSVKEFLLLGMPSVSSVFTYGMFRYYNYVYQRDTGQSPFDLYGGYDLIVLLNSVIGFITIFVMTYVYRQWKNEQEEDRQREVFSRQMQDMESHIVEVERLYRDMRRLRHDMGNHLMTLQQLYGRGEYEEAGKYAEALKLEVQDASSDVASGNPVTDVILSGRKKEMQEKGICFDCDFHYPPSDTINAFDVSIILNNALANAIEAVEKENEGSMPVITLVSCRIKNMYIIEVTNSYTGELTIDVSSGLPHTSKSGDGHGLGLINIRHVAQKYYGDIEIGKEMYEEKECFVLRVMLQLVRLAED